MLHLLDDIVQQFKTKAHLPYVVGDLDDIRKCILIAYDASDVGLEGDQIICIYISIML